MLWLRYYPFAQPLARAAVKLVLRAPEEWQIITNGRLWHVESGLFLRNDSWSFCYKTRCESRSERRREERAIRNETRLFVVPPIQEVSNVPPSEPTLTTDMCVRLSERDQRLLVGAAIHILSRRLRTEQEKEARMARAKADRWHEQVQRVLNKHKVDGGER